jgi:tetratricopeptide (TPR) repeat protein
VETERINYLLNHPSEATSEDLAMLEEAIRQYPFAQPLHVLSAKVASLLDAKDKDKKLTTAATYASSRVVLRKAIMEPAYLESIRWKPITQKLPVIDLKEVTEVQATASGEEASAGSANLFDEVMNNLRKLKALREQFLFLDEDEPHSEFDNDSDSSATSSDTNEQPLPTDPAAETTGGLFDSREQIEDSARIKQLQQADEELDSKVNEYLISQISGKKPETEPDRAAETSDEEQIIDRFIREQPSIGSVQIEAEKSQEEITKDLSERSTKFGDDLASENLAIILLKQGKRDRAIDIYKKLIWKLPQKKAYFAARIEEIKK